MILANQTYVFSKEELDSMLARELFLTTLFWFAEQGKLSPVEAANIPTLQEVKFLVKDGEKEHAAVTFQPRSFHFYNDSPIYHSPENIESLKNVILQAAEDLEEHNMPADLLWTHLILMRGAEISYEYGGSILRFPALEDQLRKSATKKRQYFTILRAALKNDIGLRRIRFMMHLTFDKKVAPSGALQMLDMPKEWYDYL